MNTAKEILKQNGKSFYFASLVLSRLQAERCARLYAFCRYVDDLADEADNKDAARRHLLGVIYDHSGSYLLGFYLSAALSVLAIYCVWSAAPRKVRMVAGQAAKRG